MATPLRPDANTRVPDGVVPLVGYREWAVQHAPDGSPTLRSLFHPTTWAPDRALGAVCLRPLLWTAHGDVAHRGVPDAACECGIYAFRSPDFKTLRGAKGPKARGVVRGWGRYVLGTTGWRCEFAAVSAIAADAIEPALAEALADRYRVPVVRSLALDEVAALRPAVGF